MKRSTYRPTATGEVLRARMKPAVGMTISLAAALVAFGMAVLPAAQGTSPHAYFNGLVNRADHWRSYSLREPQQLGHPKDGGYANSNSGPLSVTYNPNTDTDPNAQDAAKVVIPPFQESPVTSLAAAVDATSLTLRLSDLSGDVTKVTTGFNAKGRQIRIGNEVIITNTEETPLDRSSGIVTLSQRGAYGTRPSAHAAGALVALGGNSLANQVRVPLDTHDGATWLITWDGYFTDSFMHTDLGNYKTFQLSSGKAIWLEPQTHFGGGGNPKPAGYDPDVHVAVTGRVRSYNSMNGSEVYAVDTDHKAGYLGPSVTNNNPVLPAINDFFILHPNRWTRWWIRIDQRANDYDLMDLWMADEATGPTQIYRGIPLSVRPTSGIDTINEFYLEFNTSTSQLPPGRTTDFRDLVAYVRNVAVLRNPPADVHGLLVRPGATAAVPRPPSPRNLRILESTPQ